MSYVIQNFNSATRHIVFTPKTKSLILLLNLEKIFLFFKLNNHIFYLSNKNFTQINYFFLFHNYFYSRQTFLLFYKFNSSTSSSFYSNNLHNSFRYYFFKIFLLKLSKSYTPSRDTSLFCEENLVLNQYYTSVKTINYRLPKTYYKNVFFFFMLTFSFLWYQHSTFFKFYLNFLFVNNVLNLSPFYNGYFLHVYNF